MKKATRNISAITPQHRILVGLDPGVNTGFAVWSRDNKSFAMLRSMMIHRAQDIVRDMHVKWGDKLFLRVEDARLRVWFGATGKERLKGAGSVERDCTIWYDFLTDMNISFEMVHPKYNATKLDADKFKLYTKYTGSTNEHSRDAGMLVFNR